MPKPTPPYTPEFRREALRLLRTGTRTSSQLAAELGCSDKTLRAWQRQDEADRSLGAPTVGANIPPGLPAVDTDPPPRAPTVETDPPPPVPTVEAESSRRAPTMLDVLRRRWWLVALVTVLTIASAWAYSRGTPRRYQASATVLAHPSAAVTRASDYSTDLSLLSYGSLEQTFVSLARSAKLLNQAASGMGFTAAERKQYSAVANLLPASTVLEISVTGPDRDAVVTLANTLSASVSAATRQYFPIFALTPLDPAEGPSLQVEPRTKQNLLFGGLAGLIAGFVAATVSLRVRRRPDGGPTRPVAVWRRFRNAPPRSGNGR